LLEGDRLAAADAFNKATNLAFIRNAEDAQRARHPIDYRATLDWNGTRYGGSRGEAFQAWVERTTAKPEAEFSIERAIGERSDRVRIEGWLRRQEPGFGTNEGEGIEYRAPVTLLFVSESNDPGLRIQTARVGAFVRAPRVDEEAHDGR
jgi:hypothetical protein